VARRALGTSSEPLVARGGRLDARSDTPILSSGRLVLTRLESGPPNARPRTPRAPLGMFRERLSSSRGPLVKTGGPLSTPSGRPRTRSGARDATSGTVGLRCVPLGTRICAIAVFGRRRVVPRALLFEPSEPLAKSSESLATPRGPLGVSRGARPAPSDPLRRRGAPLVPRRPSLCEPRCALASRGVPLLTPSRPLEEARGPLGVRGRALATPGRRPREPSGSLGRRGGSLGRRRGSLASIGEPARRVPSRGARSVLQLVSVRGGARSPPSRRRQG
jgi:hypothetical protein